MKNRTDVVSALVSHFGEGKSVSEEKAFLLDLAYTSDEKLISKLVDIVNDIELRIVGDKSQSGAKNGYYWFELLTNDESKKFKANFNKSRGGEFAFNFEIFLDRDYESIGEFIRSGFIFSESDEGLDYWVRLSTDLRNK
jgi:hypothetical protein